ncbi:TrmH family RNA methyltransferase [Hoeflea prorocentri]|uniref:RNA methyltransferase n=1 Tax=Hoeflea prorocentri TaxID=1922333 RepID=A0A9X3ZFL4_9HYPH|nr:RNA methyltransferase [Hoeflea prorocentri]MCY6379333.1 RNA methyltransferase [Hoeflea prorocentri]MDA5397134.1 RNA methyltransferase [Hoeflea prorocentri]
MTGQSRRIVRITDPDDERVAEFRHIRERDLVRRDGRFIAEGTVVLRMLAQSDRFLAEKILLLEGRVEGVADVIEAFDPEIPVLVCNRETIDAIAGFPMHRGVLAVGKARRNEPFGEAIAGLPPHALVLVCHAISNHDNLGGLFRNAAAFGVDLVCLDAECCDPLYRKSIRVSVGSALTVPFARGGGVDDIAAQLSDAGFGLIALSPDGERPIGEVDTGPRTALLVGTEGQGLPYNLLEKLGRVRIPQAKDLDSLNVATAAGIALYCVATGQKRFT